MYCQLSCFSFDRDLFPCHVYLWEWCDQLAPWCTRHRGQSTWSQYQLCNILGVSKQVSIILETNRLSTLLLQHSHQSSEVSVVIDLWYSNIQDIVMKVSYKHSHEGWCLFWSRSNLTCCFIVSWATELPWTQPLWSFLCPLLDEKIEKVTL